MADLAHAASSLLGTYYGRDAIIRLCTYGSMALQGIVRANAAKKLQTISNQLSTARTIQRRFGDLPMLLQNLSYNLGSKEETLGLRVFGSLTNILYQFYFPVEHIAWAGDNKLIDVASGRWWVLCLMIWAAALLSTICKAILQMISTRKKIHSLRKEATDALLKEDSDASQHKHAKQQSLRGLHKQQLATALTMVKSVADLMNAINWLPPGILWSQKFTSAQSGLFGMISSVIILFENYTMMKMKQAQAKKSA